MGPAVTRTKTSDAEGAIAHGTKMIYWKVIIRRGACRREEIEGRNKALEGSGKWYIEMRY